MLSRNPATPNSIVISVRSSTMSSRRRFPPQRSTRHRGTGDPCRLLVVLLRELGPTSHETLRHCCHETRSRTSLAVEPRTSPRALVSPLSAASCCRPCWTHGVAVGLDGPMAPCLVWRTTGHRVGGRLSSSSFAVDTMHEDAERKGRPQGAQLEGRPQLDVVLIFLITFVPHAAPDVGILDFKL